MQVICNFIYDFNFNNNNLILQPNKFRYNEKAKILLK